jgi:hypothetical protein
MMPLESRYSLTPDDLLAKIVWQQSRSPSWRRRQAILRFGPAIGFIPLAVIFAARNAIQFADPIGEWERLAPFIGLLVVWIFRYPYEIKRRIHRDVKRMQSEGRSKGLFSERTLTIDDNGLRIRTAIGEHSHPWAAIEQVEETKSHAFLAISGLEAVTVRRAAFAFDGEYEEFVDAAQRLKERYHP